jgi:hypothetical protein
VLGCGTGGAGVAWVGGFSSFFAWFGVEGFAFWACGGLVEGLWEEGLEGGL